MVFDNFYENVLLAGETPDNLCIAPDFPARGC